MSIIYPPLEFEGNINFWKVSLKKTPLPACRDINDIHIAVRVDALS